MSRRPPFEPVGFAEMLEATGDYVSDNHYLYQWKGTHWAPFEDQDGERMALKWIAAGGHGTVNATNARAAYQTALRWLPIFAQQEPAAIIPLQNGYLHIGSSIALLPHDKSLGLRHVLSCNYEPSAPAPKEFQAFLARVLPDVAVQCRVQEYIGYTLLPDARFQRAQIWLGSGANGKGALANIVQALHERTAAVQLDNLDKYRMASLVGASLIYCDEVPQRNINEQAMKSLIAGELVQVERKYKDAASIRVLGKWLMLGNHIPAVTDQSTGFWRRFDIVPFGVEIPERERDADLTKRIIKHELSGVLNWALEGLIRLLARNRFDESIPAAMRTAIHAARTETNSVQAWADDLGIERTTTIETSKVDVYGSYFAWCRENGMSPVASPKFWKRLPDSVGAVLDGRMTTREGRIRTCNIRL